MKRFADLVFLRRWMISSFTLIFAWSTFSQDIPVGTWRTHFSYNDARIIAVTQDKVFCATKTGLFSREISAGSLRELSKIDGLSDVGVSALAYNENLNVLVIGYESGFVDFVFEDDLISFSDIARSNLDGDKSINDVAFNAGTTFLATDLGVIVMNSLEAEIVENYVQIGTGGVASEILQILVVNDAIFLRTSEGIQSGQLGTNLLDFSNWTRYAATSSFLNLTQVGDNIYATSGSNLMRFTNGTWEDSGFDLPGGADRLLELDNDLITAANGIIYQLNAGGFETLVNTSANQINDIASIDGNLILADGESGLVNVNGDQLSPNGPLSDTFSNLRVVSNEVYGFHAPSVFSYDGTEQVSEFSRFTGGEWELNEIPDFTNVSDVASFNRNLYFSSIGDGIFDQFNSMIITDIPGSSSEFDTLITALASGEKLWVSSFRNDNPIHLMDRDQSWTSYTSLFTNENEYLTIDLSELGIGWLGASSGLITVLDEEENEVDLISTSDGLPSSFIDIDIGVEDNAWVATSRGPALFPDASFIFSNSSGIQPTFENRTLFENEQINAVMTDGGNRIWFGTNQGLWVYDENTSEQVAVFNEANSPLPSNQIIQLAYNGSNGEVFIYTSRGLVSFRSASSIGNRSHANVNIFPNPVRPEYQGQVGLTGLARNVNVKVTDINGNLVKEIDANGGSASWDLTDVRGGQIGTGIYFFFSSSANGEETYVGKIAVVR